MKKIYIKTHTEGRKRGKKEVELRKSVTGILFDIGLCPPEPIVLVIFKSKSIR